MYGEEGGGGRGQCLLDHQKEGNIAGMQEQRGKQEFVLFFFLSFSLGSSESSLPCYIPSAPPPSSILPPFLLTSSWIPLIPSFWFGPDHRVTAQITRGGGGLIIKKGCMILDVISQLSSRLIT